MHGAEKNLLAVKTSLSKALPLPPEAGHRQLNPVHQTKKIMDERGAKAFVIGAAKTMLVIAFVVFQQNKMTVTLADFLFKMANKVYNFFRSSQSLQIQT